MPSAPLTPEQEARAQQLAADLQQALADDVLTLARSLVANEQRPFGAAEFQLRDLLLKAGAKALELSLAQKKRLPGVRCDLSGLRPGRRVPGLPPQDAPEPLRPRALPARLLLLPPLRPGPLPLG